MPDPLKILFIEDESRIVTLLRAGLEDEPIEVDVASDGPGGFEKASVGNYDAVILDIELPGYDGFEVLRRLRESGNDVPVVILTGRTDESDVVRGLMEGADDYLGKPFSPPELVARVYAVHRRAKMASGRMLRLGDVELDVVRGRATRAGERLQLTPTEFELLRVLIANPGAVISRDDLLEQVWDIRFDPGTNVLDVHLSRLRSKLEAGGGPRLIQNVRGRGFRIGG